MTARERALEAAAQRVQDIVPRHPLPWDVKYALALALIIEPNRCTECKRDLPLMKCVCGGK